MRLVSVDVQPAGVRSGRAASHRRRLAVGLWLAGTALAPVQGQTLNLAGVDQTRTSLAGFNLITNTVGTANLTLDTSGGSITYSATINQGAGVLALTKIGANTLSITRNGANAFSGGITLAGGTLVFSNNNGLGTGPITVTAASTLAPSGSGRVLPNAIAVNSALTLTGNWAIAGQISGGNSSTIIHDGPGVVDLKNAGNSFTGSYVINGGGLGFVTGSAGPGAIQTGNTAVIIRAAADAEVVLGNAITIGDIANPPAVPPGFELTQVNFEVPTSAGNALVLNGVISGPGRVYLKSGAGTLLLNNPNNNYGTNVSEPANLISSGYFGVGANGALVGGIGAIAPGNAAATWGIASYASGLVLTNNALSFGTMRFDTRGFDTVYNGVLGNRSQAQLANFNKLGAGTLTFGGTHTYTGTTTVTAGRLDVTGSIAAGAGTTVANGATLGGSGTINGLTIVTSGGIVAPGSATTPATLTFENFQGDAGSNINVRLATPGVPGGGNDLVNVTGNAVVNSTINISAAPGSGLREDTYFVLTTPGAGNLTGNPVAGSAPQDFTINTVSQPGSILVEVTYTGIRQWDGAGPAVNGVIDGGNGTWDDASLNFTDTGSGTAELAWRPGANVSFGGAGGTVTLAGSKTVGDVYFTAGGYSLTGDTLVLGGGTTLAGSSVIDVAAGQTATLANAVTGNAGVALDKRGDGTLVIAGTVTAADPTIVRAGILQVDGTHDGNISTRAGGTTAGTGTILGSLGLSPGGTISPGVSGVGTLTATQAVLNSGTLAFDVDPGGTSDRLDVTNGILLSGSPNFTVNLLPAPSPSVTTLITYGGALTTGGNSFGVANAAPAGFAWSVNTNTPGEVRLVLDSTATLYWDGAGPAGNDAVEGGNGTWNTSNSNWTNVGGTLTTNWAGTSGVFGGAGGTVTVDNGGGAVAFDDLAFNSSYTVTGGDLTAVGRVGSLFSTISVANGQTATFDSNVVDGAGVGLIKDGAGTVVLNGSVAANSGLNVAAGTAVLNGTLTGNLQVQNGATLAGSGVIAAGLASGALILDDGATLSPGTGALDYAQFSAQSASIGAATLAFELSSPGVGGTYDRLSLTGDLNLTGNPAFNLTGPGTVVAGDYTLITYGGALNLNGFNFGTSPAPIGIAYSVDTGTLGSVVLSIALTGADLYWDGGAATGNSVEGGDGTWNAANTNWTNVTGAVNSSWVPGANAFFTNTGGTVTVDGAQTVGDLNFTADGYTLGGDGLTLNSGNIVLATGPQGLTGIGNVLSGNAGLTVTGEGSLVLGGANDFTGNVVFDNLGSIGVGSSTAFGDAGNAVSFPTAVRLFATVGGLDIANAIDMGGGLNIDSNGVGLTLSGAVGNGQLFKAGAGTLTLSGNNTQAATIINAGTLAVASAGALGAGQLNFSGVGTVLQAAANNLTFANNVELDRNATIDTNGNDLRLDGNIAEDDDGLSLTKAGAGTLTLTGTNTYTGGTIIDAGTVTIDDANAIGTGTISLGDGATLRVGLVNSGLTTTLTNAVALSGPASLNVGGGLSFNADGSATTTNSLTLSGALTGTSQLTLNGGTTNFGDTSGFAGSVRIAGGLLDVDSATDLGAGAARFADGGIRNSSGNALSFANDVVASGFNIVIANNDITLSGVVSGSLLRKSGPGTLTLSNGGNSFDNLSLGSGGLAVGANGALGNGLLRTFLPATLQAAAADLAFSNSISIGSIGGDLTVDTQAFTLSLLGSKTGARGLIKVGTGTLILGGTNNYAGSTNVNEGVLDLQGTVANNINVAAGAMIKGIGTANGTVTFANGANVNPGNSPGTLTFGNLVLNNATNLNFELAGVAGVPGTDADLIIVNNDLTLDGVLNITGLAGFNVGVGNRTIITYGNLVADNTLTVSNAPPVDVTYNILTTNGVGAGAGSVLLNVAFTGTYRWDGANQTPNGVIDGGSGTFNLTNTNFTNSDGTFNLAYGNNATDDIEFGGTAGSVDVQSAGLNFDQMSFVTTGYTLGGVGSFNANGSAINVGANDARINTRIIGGPLAKNGSGTLTLAGDNSFAGFDINGGTVVAASDTALGSANVAMADGTTLVAEGNRTLANNIGLAGAATIDAATNDFTFNGTINDAGPLTLVSTGGTGTRDGRVFLNGANTYGGGTFVNGTSVIIGADNGLGAAGTQLTLNDAELRTTASFTSTRGITLASGVPDTINTDAGTTLTLAGVVDGAARLQKTGAGTLVLGNAGNSYAGGTEINAGTLSVASNGALGNTAGAVRFSGGSTLQFTANVTSNRAISIDTGITGVVDTVDNDVRLNGVISGGGTLAKDGTGRLTLTGVNTYSGGTNLNDGTLRISNGSAIGTGTLTTQDGTTFVAGLGAGAGTITLANNVVLNGGQTTVDLNGNLLVINPVTGAVSTNGTNLVLNGTITGAGGFTTSNATAGTIAINGNNSFTGNVNLNNAVVFVGNDNALGQNNTININAAAGIRNGVGGTIRTLASAVAINDPNATVGGNGNLVLTGVVSGGSNNVFNKVGLGRVTLTNANNTISSQIEVAQGELAVTGALTDANQLTNVRAGATLSGTGSIAGIVEVVNSGVLSAGVGGSGTVGTLTIGTLLLNEQSSLVFDLGDAYVQGGAFNDQVTVTGDLRLGGRLTVREAAGGTFGLGVYNLITYGGQLLAGSNNVFVQTLPGSFSGVVQTLVPGEVNLVVTQPGTFVQYWDGSDNTGATNGAQGGTGTWSTGGTNWTGPDQAELNTSWFNNSVAVFGGAAGTVTLANTFTVAGLQFATDGYVLQGGKISNESTGVGTGDFVFTSSNVNATINSEIDGNGILFKQGAGKLTLGGTNTNMTGPVQVQAGTLALANNRGAGTGAIQLGAGTTLQAAGGNRTIANAVQIAAGTATIDSQAAVFTVNGLVSGNGGFAKIGSGNLVLNGANTYAGGTALDEGTITIGTATALGTGGLNMAGGTTLAAGVSGLTVANAITTNGGGTIDSGTGTLTLNGAIDGAGSIAKINSGTLVLNGANSYAGGTALNAGTIQVGTNTALGTGTLTTAGGTSLVAGVSGLTLANAVSLGGTTTVDAGATGSTLTLAGVITGSGPLTKINTGTLILNGANGYTGGTALNAGTIQVGTSTALGTGTLTTAGGTTLVAGVSGLDLANAVALGGSTTVDTGASPSTLTLSGVVSGGGPLVKANSGTLILNGANTYGGGTSLTAGIIQVGTSTALGTGTLTAAGGTTLVAGVSGLNLANAAVLNGGLSVDSGTGSFELSGGISGPGSITKVNTGNLILSGNNSYAGGTNLNAGAITLTNNNSLGTGTLTTTGGTTVFAGVADPSTGLVLNIANAIALGAGTTTIDLQGVFSGTPASGNLLFDGASLTLAGAISGDGGLFVTDDGLLTLNGNNSFTGGVSASSALIRVGTDTALGTGTFTTSNVVGLSNASGALRTLANAVVIGGPGALNVAGPDDITLNGVVSGTGSLNKAGASTLTLNGVNTHLVTNLTAGRIIAGTNTAIGTTRMNVFANGIPTTLAAGVDGLVIGSELRLFAGSNLIVESGTGTFTFNGLVANAGSLTKVQSGTLVLNGANTYTGGTALNAGTIQVGNNTALGTNTLAMAGGTTLQAGVAGLAVANAITTAGVGTVDTQAFTFTLNGVISGAGSIAKVGSGTLVLNGANTYDGGTALNAGTIQVGTNTALGTGTLTAADATSLVAGISGLNIANTVVLNGGLTVNSGTGSFELSGGISGAGSITKINSGDLILSGSNSYTGGTNLTSGTLTVTNDNSIGTGTLATTGGTTVRAGTATGANAVITLANAVSLGAGSTTLNLQGSSLTFNNDSSIVTNGASLTLNGVVSGDGGLNVTNFGTLTLNGANSYAGGTVLATRSVVYVGSDTAVGTGTVTTNAATGLYNISGATRTLTNSFVLNGGTWLGGTSDLVLNGGISGTGFVIKAGAETLVLNGDNSFTGTSQLRDGRITVGTNSALGTGALRVFAPTTAPAPVAGLATTLTAGTNGLALANNVTLDTGSNLIVESGTGTFTLNGVISGAGSLTKVQSGTLVLNGANSFTGGTALNVGTIQVGTNTALGTNTLAMAGGTTLQAGVDGLAVANAITTAGVGTVDTQAFTFTLDGVISGAGSIAKAGSGTLVLNGANSYAGGTALNAGTIQVGTNTALGTGTLTAADATTLVAGVSGLNVANSVVLNGGLTVDSSPGSFELSGGISGSGSITKVNRGNLILSGSNSYRGGTNLNAGTLTVTNGNSIGTGTLTTTGGTTLAAGTGPNGPAITLANAISLGEGTTTVALQGTNLSLATSGAVTFDGTHLTLNGVISGFGGFEVNGRGRLTLNGPNTYSGGTTVTGAAVYVGSDTALGTGTVIAEDAILGNDSGTVRTLQNNFVAASTLFVTGPDDIVLNGVVSGDILSKYGSSTLTLNGDNTHEISTQLSGGTIVVGTSTALGSSDLLVFGDGVADTLRAGAANLALANRVFLFSPDVDLVVDTQDFVLTLNGEIEGTGRLTKQGNGNLVLNGANTYTGGTTLNLGTITVGTNTALGTGTLAMGGGTTLAAGVSGLTVANAITTAGNGTIDSGSGTFTLTGVISDAGSITKVGSGTLVLNGANTYEGGTALTAGTIQVGTNTALGTGRLTTSAGTSLVAGVSGLSLANAVTLGGSTTVDTGSGSLTLSGVIDGSGPLVKASSGTLNLSGDNSYTGGTSLNAGSIAVFSNSALGTGGLAMADGTSLIAGATGLTVGNAITTAGVGTIDSGAGVFTLTGAISGAGSLRKTGSGNLVLNGANSFAGGLAITAGRVTAGTNTAAGTGTITLGDGTVLAAGGTGLTLANAIVTPGAGSIDQGSGTFTLGGVISGAGSLAAIGSGNLVLNGANSFAGGLAINNGTVTVGTNTAAGTGTIAIANGATLAAGVDGLVLANAVTTAGTGTVNSGTGTLTLNGVVSGAGSIAKTGTGTLVLNGANTYAGGTSVTAGTLTVGSNTAAGTGTITLNTGTTLSPGASGVSLANAIAMAGNATVSSSTGSFTLAGAIGGSGSLTKTGSGTLNVTGTGTLTGATIVNAGTLNLTGSLAASAFTVQTGATLTGTGTTGALNVQSGGIVAPGGSGIGTLNVSGAAVLAGTYQAGITPAAGNDRITATGALTVGGSLAVSPTGTFTTFYQTFTLASGSSRTGTFSNAALGNFGAPFIPVLDYTATAVNLRLTPNSLVALGGPGLYGNQLTVAQTFDRAVTLGYNPQPFFNLYTQGANLPAALTELGGELHAAERRVILEDTRVVREAAFDRLNAGLAALNGNSATVDSNGRSLTFWVRAAGSWGAARPDAFGQRFSTEQTGVLGGFDIGINNFTVGAMFNYTNNDIRFETSLGQSRVRSTGGAVYAGWRQPAKGFAIGGGVAVSDLDIAGSRSITAPGLTQSLRANYGGTSWQVFGEVAYDLAEADTVRLEPFARYAYANGRTSGFQESGGIAQVTARGESRYLSVIDAGIRGGLALANFELLGSLAWHGVYGSGRGGRVDLTLDSLPTDMRIRSVALDRSAAAVELQARYNISSRINLGFGYSGIYGDRNTDHGGRATLTIGF